MTVGQSHHSKCIMCRIRCRQKPGHTKLKLYPGRTHRVYQATLTEDYVPKCRLALLSTNSN